jgi:hypothetical protein
MGCSNSIEAKRLTPLTQPSHSYIEQRSTETKYRTAHVSRDYPTYNATTCLSIMQENSKKIKVFK